MREHLETFLAVRERAGTPMPRFVVTRFAIPEGVDELRAYVRCGVLAHGAACFRCEHCERGRMVPLSCGGRGFCPRCLGGHMTELADEWTRWVLPHDRIRQWVLSLPLPLRVPLAFHHDLVLALHGVAGRVIDGWYRSRGKELGVRDGRTGAVSRARRRERARSGGAPGGRSGRGLSGASGAGPHPTAGQPRAPSVLRVRERRMWVSELRPTSEEQLYERIAVILDDARSRVARTVNTAMVHAYWLIGREIVEVEQGGAERAGYGEGLMKAVAARLSAKFGKGFSLASLKRMKRFYLVFPQGSALVAAADRKGATALSLSAPALASAKGAAASSLSAGSLALFPPLLGWSHYLVLLRVSDARARSFYEIEAARESWSVRELERQIASFIRPG